MSNYPNMSYCMNENTLQALKQVIDAMNYEGEDFLRDLSGDERRAWRELFSACEDFMTRADELQEQYDQDDGQPTEQEEWADFDPDC